MRAVLQRVSKASVSVDGRVVNKIGPGLLVLLGVEKKDIDADVEYLARKVANLRMFPDEAGKMNRTVLEIQGEVLIISQFTLYGDCRKGNRPSFDRAAHAVPAMRYYQYFVELLRKMDVRTKTGIFQAYMQVELVNDGPVTLICDSGPAGGI